MLQQKGQEHEDTYKQHLIDQGHSVHTLTERSNEATLAAMKQGHNYIIQAQLNWGNWGGRADFLKRVQGQSALGDYHYEVEDTKLAQETKAGSVIQLCYYSEVIGLLQGRTPENMFIVKPGTGFPTDKYRFSEFESYYNLIKSQFEQVMSEGPQETYPMPVSKCDTCRWWKECDQQWHKDDHLSLVAGIRTLHINELNSQEIKTLEQFAKEKEPLRKKPVQGNKETFQKLHKQAQVQLDGRVKKQLVYELLPVEPLRGLNRLPVPSKGDFYFDIEGDHFYEDGGLEYLLGLVYNNDEGNTEYLKLWAKNRTEEKEAFKQFMEFVLERWKKHPDMYIYHFAPYEPSAIQRLASRHAIFETEVDDLLRAEKFIDLYAITKETLQASVESYSLKELEGFTGFIRQVDLRKASEARRRMATSLELKATQVLPDEDYQVIEGYNKDDCLATMELHTWLESIYQDQSSQGVNLQRPEEKAKDASENVAEEDAESRRLYELLVNQLPSDPSEWTSIEKAQWLLAHQIDYFRREDKNAWWEYFRLHKLDDEEALDDRHAILGLTFEKELPKQGRERNPTHRYKFPSQEATFDEDDTVEEILGEKIGDVVNFSIQNCTIDIKKSGNAIDIHPHSIHVREVVPGGALAASLRQFAQAVIDYGLDEEGPYRAGRDLLLRNPPRLKKGVEPQIRKSGETVNEAALRVIQDLNEGILPIQGPPGTGKTHLGAELIIDLVRKGNRVGVTAVSHKVVRNLLDKALKMSRERETPIDAVHKPKKKSETLPEGLEEVTNNDRAYAALGEGKVVGGTAWLWANDDAEEQLDYLFVDEAGQMSLSYVLAISRSARNIILLGDPQQLEQPQKGAHPEGSEVSALHHVLNGKQTMPEDLGLFLDLTWRLNPSICQFTSSVYYEGKLQPKKGLEVQQIEGNSNFSGSGLFLIPVEHTGNRDRSFEEVKEIKSIVDHLLSSGLTWTDRGKKTRNLTREDILIVAPYNAQVGALSEALPEIQIGTVDKFQGQEAPVVIYSMTSSSPEDAPRGMSFLYNPNRLNVATSRAQCICILVVSPLLFQPECHSVDQMKWANGLCRYRERAITIQSV
ncbi:MAG: TM0106 family RecB-like putative nuclease [Bacteroidota bacterium]